MKTYTSGDTAVTALRGVSIDFREHEFVSILGPSGCGKTTLLNVIGGLDRYDGGDLIIGGRSTKEFTDADWDTYRNHSVGFVFQSYNLIMHQTVLANVELALTLSGVSREERRRRAIEALEQVGLGDQLHKKPNQMSGGQMQRVAIARALVNDPDIILADEPTGALDTVTSVQIMEILKSVSAKKLIVMVTHNPDLAAEYSSRIIRLLDGEITEDTNPYRAETAPATAKGEEGKQPEAKEAEASAPPKKAPRRKKKRAADDGSGKGKRSMSFFTALALSFNNLLTKKTRTLLVSVAGSIGIIGIALILALSNGVDLFIAGIQEETLTSYPISITAQTSDYSAMLSAMVGTSETDKENRDPDKVYVDDSISNMVQAMTSIDKNNLARFNEYLMSRYDEIKNDLTAIQYSYNMDLQIFNANSPYADKGLMQVSPSDVLSGFSDSYSGLSGITDNISIFSEIMPGRDGELINSTVYEQYDLVSGRWPESESELVLVVDRHNTVSNITLYMLGMLDPDEMTAMMASMMIGEKYEANTDGFAFSFDDFFGLDLFLAYNSDFYAPTDAVYEHEGISYPVWGDKRDKEGFDAGALRENGMDLKIVGIICPDPDATSTSISGSIAYTAALTDTVLAHINGSEIVKQQLKTPSHDVFTGLPFSIEDAATLTDAEKIAKLEAQFSLLNPAEKVTSYLAIRTAVTDLDMFGADGNGGYMAKIKEVINTPQKQKQFLIDLYGFNSKNGSLAPGTSANEAVAAILLAADIVPGTDLDGYKAMVPGFASMFELDNIALVNDPASPSYEIYRSYEGLISNMYNTEEKMTRAFESMTASTFKMVYAMVQTQNLTSEAKLPTAPHFAAFLAGTLADMPTAAEQRSYLLTHLMTVNGITSMTDSLAAPLYNYVYVTLQEADGSLATKYYTTRIDNDEDFRQEAIAACFDAWRADMVANHSAEYAALYADHIQKSDATYDEVLIRMGASVSADALSTINIYPVDFEAKERLQQLIKDYNNQEGLAEEDRISYVDMVGLMMASVTVIIDAISYVLIAFVSISLVVSSIMIGIITYISVLERTKEIGILRAIGASKKDISRVFNAETLIIGFAAGAIGILATLLFCIPINLIIHALSGLTSINASLPVAAAFILVAISMGLTLIAGLIPSRIASKKDPVVALRSE
ncbi:MAG: ABC transporter ATP-binding protein/permease [Ruminococcaceae bacterium]|nr:ABC transporter ATP-binding protein/permease [Oscillospiraceae bacterium]